MIDAVDALSVEAQKFLRIHRGFGYPIRAAAGSGVFGPRVSAAVAAAAAAAATGREIPGFFPGFQKRRRS
jgi:hypothetical protein